MPARKPTKAKATTAKSRIVRSKIKQAGKTTRVKGHLVATTARRQAKRDRRNG
jgi:hypothetical protein